MLALCLVARQCLKPLIAFSSSLAIRANTTHQPLQRFDCCHHPEQRRAIGNKLTDMRQHQRMRQLFVNTLQKKANRDFSFIIKNGMGILSGLVKEFKNASARRLCFFSGRTRLIARMATSAAEAIVAVLVSVKNSRARLKRR